MDLDISSEKKKLVFIGLNPSLSSSNYLDNTTKKIIKICDTNNYGRVKIINLFGLISKDPKLLYIHKDPVGNINDQIINENIQLWAKDINCNIWLGWGNNGHLFNRNKHVYKLLKKYFYLKKMSFRHPLGPLVLKKTKFNNPIHPLYCKNNSNLYEDYFINRN